MYVYTYIHIYISLSLYIYIERERYIYGDLTMLSPAICSKTNTLQVLEQPLPEGRHSREGCFFKCNSGFVVKLIVGKIINSLYRTYRSALSILGAKHRTPETNTSEIIVDFQWHFPTIVSCMFQQKLIVHCKHPKVCHFSKGLSLECSDGFPEACSNGA